MGYGRGKSGGWEVGRGGGGRERGRERGGREREGTDGEIETDRQRVSMLTKYITESGLSNETRRSVGILHIGDGYGRVEDTIINYRVYSHSDSVTCQNL